MSEPSNSSKVSKTEDDSAVKSSSSTDLKRGAFGKGRALSSKQLGSKKISSSTTSNAELDKEKIKKSLLEQPEKKKKSKEAAVVPEASETLISDPQPERITIQPLDEATQNALKKRSKRRGSDSSGDPNKAQKSKRSSKEVEVEEKPAPVPSTKRRDSHDESSDSESSKSKKKHRRSQSPSKQIPQLPVAVAVMPPILSDRSGPEDDATKALSSPPSFPPPLTPNGSSTNIGRSPSPGRAPSNPLLPQASPRPFSMAPLSARSTGADSPNVSPGVNRPVPPGSQRDATPPPPPPAETPDVSDESLPPPPPSEDASTEDAPTPAASTDSLTGDIPVHTMKMSDSQSSLPLAQITVSNSSSSIGADSEDEDSVKESKKEKRRKNRTDSVDVDAGETSSSKHTRERSGTKGRRDSDTVSPLAIASIPPVSPTSTPLSSSRGLMRLNRTPRGENVSSPRGQILIINPAGDASQVTDVAPPPPHTTVIAAIPIALPGLSDSSPSVSSLGSSAATRRDSVDISTDDLPALKGSLNSSMSGSMSEVPPPPPPMPTIGVPPPPPMMSRGAAAVSVVPRRDSDAQYEGEIVVARTRTRRVVPQVEAAVKLWDSRATNFEQRMVSEVTHKTAPEELLEFPADDLLLEIVNSQLQHYPSLDPSAPPSVRDCYSSYTSQLKIICRQSLWYGTETSPKDRFKEYETRMSRAKVEAAQAAAAQAAQAAAHPVAEIRNKSSANARRPSISRGTGSETAITRRASRSIKMTNSSSIPGSDDVASALPDLNEDEDSSAQESYDGEESASETSIPIVEVRFSTFRHTLLFLLFPVFICLLLLL